MFDLGILFEVRDLKENMNKKLLLVLVGMFVTNAVLSQITKFPNNLKIRSSDIPCDPIEPYGYETFYPVGWSSDGLKIAYFTEGFTDGIGSTGSFNIFDLATNKKIVDIYQEGLEGDVFSTPQDLLEYFNDSINILIAKHDINSNQEINYKRGSLLKIEDQRYFLHSEINISDDLYSAAADYASVLVIKEGIGLKHVFEYKKEEHNNELLYYSLIEPLGMLISPNSKMAVVLSDVWSRGFEGGSDTSLMLVGFNLNDGYNW